jgi:hypothetical protein
MRLRMTLSSGLSEATPFSRIQTCCRIWSAVARFLGSCGAAAAAVGIKAIHYCNAAHPRAALWSSRNLLSEH